MNTVLGHRNCHLPPCPSRRISSLELRDLLRSVSSTCHLGRPPGLHRQMPGRSGCGPPTLCPCPTAQHKSHRWWKKSQVWAQLYSLHHPRPPKSNPGVGIWVWELSPGLRGRCPLLMAQPPASRRQKDVPGVTRKSKFLLQNLRGHWLPVKVDKVVLGVGFPHSVRKKAWLACCLSVTWDAVPSVSGPAGHQEPWWVCLPGLGAASGHMLPLAHASNLGS